MIKIAWHNCNINIRVWQEIQHTDRLILSVKTLFVDFFMWLQHSDCINFNQHLTSSSPSCYSWYYYSSVPKYNIFLSYTYYWKNRQTEYYRIHQSPFHISSQHFQHASMCEWEQSSIRDQFPTSRSSDISGKMPVRLCCKMKGVTLHGQPSKGLYLTSRNTNHKTLWLREMITCLAKFLNIKYILGTGEKKAPCLPFLTHGHIR